MNQEIVTEVEELMIERIDIWLFARGIRFDRQAYLEQRSFDPRDCIREAIVLGADTKDDQI